MAARAFACAAALAVAAGQQNMVGSNSAGLYTDFAGCIPQAQWNTSWCIFPTTGATLLAGQRFDARVEYHVPTDPASGWAATMAKPVITMMVYPNGASAGAVNIGDAVMSPLGVATANDVTSGNSLPAGYAFPTVQSVDPVTGAQVFPTGTWKWAWGWQWRNLYAPPGLVGTHAFVVLVGGVEVARTKFTIAPISPRLAKNVILFVGDGMNHGIITATRLASRGIKNGKYARKLNMQSMAKLGFVSTNGYDAMITDSANSAAAYASGHKQAVNSLNVYADSYDTTNFKPSGIAGPYTSTTFSAALATASYNDDPKVETIVEMAKRKYGAAFGVGVVTTSEIQDATPAAFFAHTRRRNDKAEITRQFFEGWDQPATPPAARFSAPPAIDVLMGGGANYFAANPALPVVVPGTGVNGVATVYCKVQLVAGACPPASQSAVLADAATAAANFPLSKAFSGLSGRNFYAEAAAKYNYTVAYDRSQMYQTINTNNKLLGVFHYGNMDVWTDRHDPAGPANNINILPYASPVVPATGEALANMPKPLNQPDLAEMTDVAIRSLRNKPAGFFLMVEGASIDKQEHPMDMERTLGEMIDFDNAVGVALQSARANGDTLVLVTADHGHAFDVVGTVDRAVFNARDALTTDPAQKKLLRESAIQTYATAGTPTYVDNNGDNFPDNFGTRFGLAGGYGDVTFQKLDFQPKAQNPADNSNQDLGSAAAAAAQDVGDHFGAGNTGLSTDKSGYTNGMTVGRTLSAARAWDNNAASGSGVHTLQDVPLYGEGPGSAAIQTSMANTELFGLMAGALGLGGA